MKNKITDVSCRYTGGNFYTYSAKYGDYFLYGSFCHYIGCYKIHGAILFDDEWLCEELGMTKEYESFVYSGNSADYDVDSSIVEYPTWQDILDSIKDLNDPDAEENLKDFNPDLTKRTDED